VPVRFEVSRAVVPSTAIQFEHQSIADHDVDPADTVDDHLSADVKPQSAEPQARKTLDARLARRIDPANDGPSSSGHRADLVYTSHRDEPAVEGGIQGDHGLLRGPAREQPPNTALEILDSAHANEVFGAMHHETVTDADVGLSRDTHVKSAAGQCPHAVESKRRYARDGSSEAGGRGLLLGEISGVPSVTHSHDGARTYS
jgi:hypothetical protein